MYETHILKCKNNTYIYTIRNIETRCMHSSCTD